MKNIRLTSLSIECSEISPCGGNATLKPIGHYQVISDINGDIIDEYTKEVNAIIRIDKNNWFKLNNKTLVFDANLTDKPISVNVSAYYLFKGKKIVARKEIVQEPNVNKGLTLSKTIIESISISSSKNRLSKHGDEAKISVCSNIVNVYEQYDSCGNKINVKQEKIHNKDITNDCELLLVDNHYGGFELNETTVICNKQDIGANERKCKIIAKYGDKTDHTTIVQEQGSKVTFTNELYFNEGGSNYTEIELIDNVGAVEFTSKKNMVCEDKVIDTIINDNFTIRQSQHDDWFEVKISILGKSFLLTIDAKTRNELDTDRVGYFEVISEDGNSIGCNIIQPSKKILDSIYSIFISGDREYTLDEIDNTLISFISTKKIIYDDGSVDVKELSYEDKINIECISSRSSILSCSDLIMSDFNGKGYIVLNINDKIPFFDDEITLHIKAYISDRNTGKVYDTSINEFTIIIKNDLKSKYADCKVKIILNKENNEEIIIKDTELIIETMHGIEVIERKIPYIWIPYTAKYDVILYEKMELLDGMEYRIYDTLGKIKESTFIFDKKLDEILVNVFLV